MSAKQLMANWSIRKKITAVFLLLVLLPAVLLGSAVIRSDIVHKRESAIAETSLVLQLMADDINTRSSQVEYLIGLLATSKSIKCIFDQDIGYGEYARRLNDDVDAELSRMTAYLYDLRASIVLLTDETLPEKYEFIMNKARFLPNADIESLNEGNRSRWGAPGWHMPEGLPNYTFYAQQTIPYYQLIVTDFSTVKGIIKCSVAPERLFQILETWDSPEPISVMRGNEVIYTTGAAAKPEGATQISVPIQSMDMNLVACLPGISAQEAFSTVMLTAGLICLFVLVLVFTARALLGRVLGGFNDINHAIDELNSGRYNEFRFPEYGHDEIGRLFDAFNRLLDVYWAQNQQMIEQKRNMHSAQLLALQCQMNPHFLFNALNWLQLSIETGHISEETSDAVAHLSNVLHYNMVSSYLSTVGDEIRILDEYKAFLDARDLGEITISVDCPEGMKEERFLRFALQPLVENAIRHGRQDGRRLRVEIMFRLMGDTIYLRVRNDGLPLSDTEEQEINDCLKSDRRHSAEGVGLYNLARRLHLLHQSASIRIFNQDGYVTLEICANRLSEVTRA